MPVHVLTAREVRAIDRCIIYCAASARSIDDRVAKRAQLAYELEKGEEKVTKRTG